MVACAQLADSARAHQSLPQGGRFNSHKSKSIFEIIPRRDIPGPGAYENLREVFPEDPPGIRYGWLDVCASHSVYLYIYRESLCV